MKGVRTVLPRLLAVLGVAYLALVSLLYLVQADRASDVERTAPAVSGTVVRLEEHNQSDVRDLFRARTVTVPVISFTVQGKRHEFVDESARKTYQVGDVVPVIYIPASQVAASGSAVATDSSGDLMLIKGEDISTLRAVAAGFATTAVAAAWAFVVMGLIQLRRRHVKGRRRVSPQPLAA